MNSSLIVRGDLDKVRRDLEGTSDYLRTYWQTTDTVIALSYINSATEALMRAVSTLTLAVERLADLPECDHQCPS